MSLNSVLSKFSIEMWVNCVNLLINMVPLNEEKLGFPVLLINDYLTKFSLLG